ncbi:MAG: type IV pilus twitching motility protein PilT [Pyrinomonadaceae bacterium]
MDNTTLTALLEMMVRRGGSDLHITTNSPPRIRVDGRLQPVEDCAPLDAESARALIYSLLSEPQRGRFETELSIDFSFELTGVSRFRANVFDQRGGAAAVFRTIPYEIKSFDELGLPPVVEELCDIPRGLILVTGPTGSGKSTTLAAMIDKLNRERSQHILTIEDPIEFIHRHKNCLVNQREVGTNAHGFADALRVGLRQDPDVVLVGELRDLETIEAALRIAETGHLTFATLHTNSAASTITRIVDIFPAIQQPQIRTQLAQVLEGVLSQQLLPRASGDGRVMALEVMLPDQAIRHLIRTDKVHSIYSVMTTGQRGTGMLTLNQSLCDLYMAGEITLPAALNCSSDTKELKELIDSKSAPGAAIAGTRNASAGGGLMDNSLRI